MQHSAASQQEEIQHVLHPMKNNGDTRSPPGGASAMPECCSSQGHLPMVLTLHKIDSIPEGSNRMCPIAMDDFDKARVDFLPEDASFIEGQPEFCVGFLPCGHSFNALSILCHMTLSGMRCPVCRYAWERSWVIQRPNDNVPAISPVCHSSGNVQEGPTPQNSLSLKFEFCLSVCPTPPPLPTAYIHI